MKIYNNLKKFEFRSSFKTWLYRITVNAALNAGRTKMRETSFDENYDGTRKAVDVEKPKEYESDTEDRNKLLESLLNKLNPEQRVCIVLREIEGLSYKDIAAALRIKINTVRSRLKRVRLSLLAVAKG